MPDPIPMFRPDPPVVIGLLGGVAAGKSTVAGLLAERGLSVLDADREARRVTATDAVTARIRARFGDAVFSPADGALDRAALADRVFADPAAKRDLEAIIHPAVRTALTARLDAWLGEGTSVVLDIPLLLESGWQARCDHCLFVDSSPEVREARGRSRGWDAGEVARREANQTDLATKRAAAGAVVQNDGDRAATAAQLDAILRRWA